MQIPSSAGMLANSVLPVTPIQGGLLSQVGETAGSASFAPVEAVSNISLSRSIPDQRAQPDTAPENAGRPEINPVFVNEHGADKADSSEKGVDPRSAQDGSASTQHQTNENSERSENESKQQVSIQEQQQQQQQQQDLKLTRSLSQRDREVQAHENAHSAVGGQYAGSAHYTYQRGPDGVNYAVGGEVPIDVGVIQGNPAATLEKMQVVQRAALAPAEPSSQDRKVSVIAAQQANQARAEIVIESRDGSSSGETSAADKSEPSIRVSNDGPPRNSQDSSESSEPKSQSISNSQNFQATNDRIAKINEIIVAISQNHTSQAAGQLLDAVV
ncbi:MAG: hypothetical protein ACI910_001835 [Oleispira sp.]|jgi:hypothetical protein